MKPATLSGIVVQFQGNGRKLGYPTANLAIETDLQDGVYFGFADLAGYKHHPALIFVGTPTTMGDNVRRVEAHLLDIPDEDYYGERLKVILSHYHRPNQTFKNTEGLLKAMLNDETTIRGWLS